MSATGELIPVDADARALVTTTGLDRTLFVEAGAGTGKTTALVARIVSLVTVEDIDLRTIAAITFTEAAAAELRDRVRHELERASDHTDATVATRARRALDHVDAAPISTLHSFAQRLLIEHPLEVGIPPRVEVLDEVQSTLAFEARWSAALDQWLDDPRLEELITRTALLRIRLNEPGGASLRTVAGVLADNWDRLENWSASVDLDEPYTWPLHPIDLEPLHRALRAALALPEQCTNPDDKLATFIRDRRTEFELLLGDDPHRCLRMLAERNGRWGGNRGAQGNWPDVKAARAVLDEADAAANALVTQVSKEVLRRWLLLLTRFTLDAAHERTASGRLEFHDLLVLARRLLRNSPHAREALAARYRRLLLDEFQDTDPIQIELAVLSKVTSTLGTPRGAGGRPSRWNLPRVRLKRASARSPCSTWISTDVWLSLAVE